MQPLTGNSLFNEQMTEPQPGSPSVILIGGGHGMDAIAQLVQRLNENAAMSRARSRGSANTPKNAGKATATATTNLIRKQAGRPSLEDEQKFASTDLSFQRPQQQQAPGDQPMTAQTSPTAPTPTPQPSAVLNAAAQDIAAAAAMGPNFPPADEGNPAAMVGPTQQPTQQQVSLGFNWIRKRIDAIKQNGTPHADAVAQATSEWQAQNPGQKVPKATPSLIGVSADPSYGDSGYAAAARGELSAQRAAANEKLRRYQIEHPYPGYSPEAVGAAQGTADALIEAQRRGNLISPDQLTDSDFRRRLLRNMAQSSYPPT